MEPVPELLILLPLAVAAGLDLYLTLTFLGVGLFLGFVPPGAAGIPPFLGAPIILGLAFLYATEAFMETRPSLVLVWQGFQLVLRPLGAGLLALFILRAEPFSTMFVGAFMSSVVAAFSHVVFWGKGLLLRIVPNQRLSLLVYNLAGDLAALILLVLTLFQPDLGVLLATLFLLLALFLGRGHHGAVRFGLTLLHNGIWGIVSPTVWQTEADLPSWIRKGVAPNSLGTLRGARAATWGIVAPGRFSDGWILQENRGILFAFREGRAFRFIPMNGMEERVEAGPLCRTIRYQSPEGVPSALFLQVGLIGPESHK